MSTIENGLRADVMRNKMESKDALTGDGYIYVGTGNKIKIEADGNTYEIPETTGMDIREAITKYGAKALNPISISSKDQLVNTDSTLTELAKKSFAYTVSDPVKLQDAANNKEEVIIPALSKGMVLSDTADLLVTYGNTDISGSFFYNHSDKRWTIVKANIANILDSATMKTTNDGLIPKTADSVNLGSNSNHFNTIYTRYYNGNGINFRPTQFKEDTTGVDIGYGYDAAGAADPAATTPKAHIDTHIFYDGLNQGELSWIKAKGLVPYKNNEINIDLNLGSTTNNIIHFGYRDSTDEILGYNFWNGKGNDGHVADIGCNNINAHEIKSDAVIYNGSGNIDNTKCHYFIVPDGKTQSFGTIALPPNTKGAISSSGGDCCLWYVTMANADSVAGFLAYNAGSNGGWYKSAIEAPYFNATSDKRLKENIVPFTSEKSILDLPVYTFNFKSDKNKKKHVGCLAQDLQEICPDLVNEDSQGYLSIEESKITYLLLEEVKELKKQVEELKGKINELEGK